MKTQRLIDYVDTLIDLLEKGEQEFAKAIPFDPEDKEHLRIRRKVGLIDEMVTDVIKKYEQEKNS